MRVNGMPRPMGRSRELQVVDSTINFLAPRQVAVSFARPLNARVVELVDTQVSEACA